MSRSIWKAALVLIGVGAMAPVGYAAELAGTARFQIGDARSAANRYEKVAAVRRPLHPLRATGDDTTRLPLGPYRIVETGQRVTRNGHWTLDAVLCDGH